MKKGMKTFLWIAKIILGCALFSVGFAFFLEPNNVNAGGITGLAMIVVHLLGFGTVGLLTLLINLPLFIVSGIKIGKKFFVGSLVGLTLSSVMLDMLALLPHPQIEPLVAALYGGLICGVGLGVVFAAGASTGGSDIVVRLLKLKYENVPIGTISIIFDAVVVVLTGLVFWDISKALYSGVTVFVCGQVIDAVVYRFDYSKVALIITKEHEKIAQQIGLRLDRGATYLNGQGSYSQKEMKIVLSVVKKQQVAELKRLVMEIDPDAFVVVQEAHQVLGEGFSRYSRDSL
ncbi:MAG: YitT family protein [Oscillospiraceae bacterium]|nr:YitT family protein [Oscillospiraceae bacterium]